jgi:hypothetical protein
MNKKELILELMKTKLIRDMVASRQFKLSDIKSVIMEQVLLEVGESIENMRKRLKELDQEIAEVYSSTSSMKAIKGLKKQKRELEAKIEQAEAQQASQDTPPPTDTSEPLKDLDQQAAAVGRELDGIQNAAGDDANARDLIAKRQRMAKALKDLKAIGARAKKTTSKKDDKAVAQVVDKEADMLQKAMANLEGFRRAFSDDGNNTAPQEIVSAAKDEIEGLAIEIEDDNEKAEPIVKAAEKADAEQTGQQGDDTTDTTDDTTDTETDDASTGTETEETTTLAAPGWKNAAKSIRDKLQDKSFQEVKESTKNFESFKKFFGVRGSEASQEAKYSQAQEIMTDDWIAGELQKIQEKFDKAKDQEAKQQAIDDAGNLATFVNAADMAIGNVQIDPATIETLRNLLKTKPVPQTKEQFENNFAQPLAKIVGTMDTSMDKGGLKEDQYIEIFDQNAQQSETLKSITDEALKVFGGWYIMSKQSGALEEGEEHNELISKYGNINDFWDSNKESLPFVDNGIKQNIKERFRDKDPDFLKTMDEIKELIDDGKISIPDSITIAQDPDKKSGEITQQDAVTEPDADQDEATEPDTEQDAEQDANADFEDVSTMDPVEFAEAQKEQLETFFGKNPKKASFMRKFLLRDQAKLLYDAMGALEGIANLDGEKLALTRNRPEKVTNPEEPTEDPKGDETKQNLEEQDTSNVEMDDTAGDEPNEQVADTNNQAEPKQKKIKIDKRFRQYVKSDLQAMVDVMRDVRKLVVQYEKNATRSSVDPRYDGSRLKKKLTELLEEVQEDIADMIQTMHKAYAPLKMTFTGEENDEENIDIPEGIILEDDGDAERKAKIDFVEEVYNNAKREYLGQLRVSLNSGDFAKAQEGAKKVYDILNNKEFLGMFPTNVIRGGKVMTLKAATEQMSSVIQEFIEIVRDVVLLAKGEYVSPENIGRAKRKLRDISLDIEDMFKVPSQIDPKTKREIDKDTASKPDEKPLTNSPATEPEVKKKYEIDSKQGAAEWFKSLNSGQQEVLEKLYNAMKEEGVISERQESFWDELNTGAHLKTNRRTLVSAFGKLEQKDRKILDFLIKNDKDNLIRFIGFIKGDSVLAQEIFSNKSQEPDGVAQLSLNSDDVTPSQSRVGDEVATNTGAEQGDSVMGRDEATKQLVSGSYHEIPDIVVEFLKHIADEIQISLKGRGVYQEGFFNSAKRMVKSFVANEEKFIQKFEDHDSDIVKAALEKVDFRKLIKDIDVKDLVQIVEEFISQIKTPHAIAEELANDFIYGDKERRFQLASGGPPANPMSTEEASNLIRDRLKEDYDLIASGVYGAGASEKIFHHFTQLIGNREPGKLTVSEITEDLQEFLNKEENEEIAKKALEIQEAQREFRAILPTSGSHSEDYEKLDNYEKALEKDQLARDLLEKLKKLLPEEIRDKVFYSAKTIGATIEHDSDEGYTLEITDSNTISFKTMQEYRQNIENRGKLVRGIPAVYYILTEFLKQNSEESSDTESTENGEEVSSDSTISANDDTSGNTSSTDSDPKPKKEGLEESLKPIIEKMLKEHYNY